MDSSHDRIIPIQAAPAGTGCSACLHGDDGQPVCRSALGEACAAPALSGPVDEVQRLLAVLAPALGFDSGPDPSSGTGWVRSLSVTPDEVSLQLAAGAHCHANLADQAFQVLRRLLPDTDIYVNLAD